jgi:hypothetical protein
VISFLTLQLSPALAGLFVGMDVSQSTWESKTIRARVVGISRHPYRCEWRLKWAKFL